MPAPIPVIDLFAGPGGLSEGFSRHAAWTGTGVAFRSVLSIEKSEPAARTLRLRTFYRKFAEGSVPEAYWKIVRGEATPDSLEGFPEWEEAGREVWQAELGEVPLDELHGRISDSLGGTRDWALLGGPPCQAYSLAGRSRMTGIGFAGRSDPAISEEVRKARLSKFGGDKRHTLYREYLRILAVHQPAVFVMENVKGILSAKVPGEDLLMFDRIRADLQNPWTALEDDANYEHLTRLRRGRRHRYRLYSFAGDDDGLWHSEPANRSFLIRAEEFGVPQKRHRVIVLGVRDDVYDLPAKLVPSERRTVRDAIGHLPKVRSGVSRGRSDSTEDWLSLRREFFDQGTEIMQSAPLSRAIAEALTGGAETLGRGAPFVRSQGPAPDTALERWLSAPRLGGFAQHETRAHMPSDLGRYLYAAAAASVLGKSPKLHEWPVELLPAHRNVSVTEDGGIESTGFADRFKVQVWTEAASTVTAHIAKDGHYFIHPDALQTRSLTVREAARLQTFPDDYFFCGNRTEAYTQIGNAVPPLLGLQLATVVAALFPQQEEARPALRATARALSDG